MIKNSNDKPIGKNWQFSPKVTLEESLDNKHPSADGNLSIPVINKTKK
jgi:hypothetical protein